MISRSDKRHTFQLEKYLESCKEKNEEPDKDYVEMYKNIFLSHNNRFDDHEKRVNNMEYDLLTTGWILEKVRNSDSYAQNLYAAMCNNSFCKNDVWPIIAEQYWSCSWRHAGGIIADMREKGDYIDWYCSGIRGSNDMGGSPPELENNYVSEGDVTDKIREDLLRLGWIVVDDE